MERSVLPSGVRVLTEHVAGQRSAVIGAWIAAGGRHEPDGADGVSHFLEHLLFKGTPSRSALQIAQAFDAVGGDLNAYTTREFTCVHARVLREDVGLATDTIADVVANPSVAVHDVESERSVVLEEIAMHEDTPDDIVFDVFAETLFPGDPLGRRVQGTEQTVRTLSAEQIRLYHGHRYRPGSVVFAVAGNVDHDEVVARIGAWLGDAAPSSGPAPAAAAAAVPGRFAMVERDIEQTHLVYGTRGVTRSDERRWALGVLNVALGGGLSSRLFQEIREKRGLAYAISSGHQGFVDSGMFTVYAGCSPSNAAEVMTLVREQIDAVAADGLSDEEHERAVGHLRGSLAISMDDPGASVSHMGKSELLLPEILSVDEMVARVEAVTPHQVRAVARELFVRQPWTLVALGPSPSRDVSGFAGEAA